MSYRTELERIWKAHLYDGFPREVLAIDPPTKGVALRDYVQNFEEFCKFAWEFINEFDIYVGVYPRTMADRDRDFFFTPNKIYMDFDDEEHVHQGVLLAVRKALKHLRSRFECKGTIMFSGNKGFHLFTHFEALLELDKPSSTIRGFVRDIQWLGRPPKERTTRCSNCRRKVRMKKTGRWHCRGCDTEGGREPPVKFIDTSVLGDLSRVSRIPGSIHQKTKMLCIPIDPSWSLKKVLKQAKKPTLPFFHHVTPAPRVAKELRRIDSLKEELKVEVKRGIVDTQISEMAEELARELYPGSELAARALTWFLSHADQIKDGRHRMLHFIIVPHLVQKDSEDKEIHQFCKEFVEKTGKHYEEYRLYVMKSIERTRRDDWKPWGLQTFIDRYSDLRKYLRRRKL